MATGDSEVTSVLTSESWNPATDQQPDTLQAGPSNTEADEAGTKRAKLLRRTCILSLVILPISFGSISVGILAWFTSDSKFPYVMCGGAISGGMAFLNVLFVWYVYFEGKKTKTGTKMTPVFTGCLGTLTVWFFFLICGLLMVLAISGIWATIKCDRALKKTGNLDVNPCLEHTDEKFIFSILTLIMSAVLFALSLAVMSVFTCNRKIFGLKSLKKTPIVRSLTRSRYEFIMKIKQEAREEALREFRSEMNALNNGQDVQDRLHVEPSAPPLEDTERLHDQRRYDYRDHQGGPHDEHGYRPRPRSLDQEQDRRRNPRRPSPRGRPDRGQRERIWRKEEPPPRYEEVVKDYIKPEDV